MVIGRLLSPVHSLGPGERVCLWTKGCARNCRGCISRELQDFSGENIDETALAALLVRVAERAGSRALTISGGDPMAQPEALLCLLRALRAHFDDILLYTGFTLEELRALAAGAAGRACLDYIDVLIDGPYIDERNTPDCVLRGSSNQEIHFLTPALKPRYEDYMRQGRVLESFAHGDTTIITGIFNRGGQA